MDNKKEKNTCYERTVELYSGVMKNEICNFQGKEWNCKILD